MSPKSMPPSPAEGTTDPPTLKAQSSVDGSVAQRKRELDEVLSMASLEDQANCLQRWTLGYLDPLLSLGATRTLQVTDMGGPSSQDKADRILSEVLAALEAQSGKKSLAMALFTAYGRSKVILGWLAYVLAAFLGFLPIMILSDLVKYFQSLETDVPLTPMFEPWVSVALMAIVPVIVTLLVSKHGVVMSHMAVYVRTAVSLLVYRKVLTVSPSGKATTSTGQVVNMMSNDTTQMQRFLQFVGFVTVAPFQVVLALYLIYQQVGNCMWIGLSFLVCLAPVNVIMFIFISKFRKAVLRYSDDRVKLVNEVLSGIRIIKFYAWERPFLKEIWKIREEELYNLTRLAYISGIGFSLILLSAPLIQNMLVFLAYTHLNDEPLDAATAFTTVALFGIMRFPFAFMPMGFLQYIQSKIALNRVQRYMDLDDLEQYVVGGEQNGDEIVINNGSFAWTRESAESPADDGSKEKTGEPKYDTVANQDVEIEMAEIADTSANPKAANAALTNIDLKISKGGLYACVGSVGSGKSSILSAILGEMIPLDESTVELPYQNDKNKTGYTSYCSQTPWVVNDTLRGNILFGRPYSVERYNQVIQACALTDDLSVLPAGDLTEIGEKGINLSGGQKARVGLARAMYGEASLLLMDDPLSAVDSHVGEHLFSKAVNGLADGKTRILVTHHVQFLPRCDKVIVMENGTVKHCDTYDNLVKAGVDFAGAVKFEKNDSATKEDDKKKKRADSIGSDADSEDTSNPKEFTKEQKSAGKNLTTDEEREEGEVDGDFYSRYISAGGTITAAMVVFIQGLGRASELAGMFWLAKWAKDATQAEADGDAFTESENTWYMNIFALFGCGSIFCLAIRALCMAAHRLRASRKIHEDLTESVLRAPVSYFDVTPTGRILNRFAADMDKIDLELTQSLAQGVGTMFNVLGAVCGIVAATKGTLLLPLIPMGYIYYIIQKWFRRSSTEIQRVESVTRSPIFSDFSQTLSGTSTIRAYGEAERFMVTCKKQFDVNNANYQLVQLTNNWLGIRLDVMGGLIGAFIAMVAVLTKDSAFIPAGWLGLALNYSIEVTGFLKHGVRMIAQIEAQMNSVERVLYYSDNIDPEADAEKPNDDPDANWPSSGGIVIKDASLRYRGGPEVLKSLTFSIKGGEKIGVVGRTGSGKSSLMTALFRMVELSKGSIEIDGVDIAKIGTLPLRSKLSIIPQDPVLFSNTVRYNVDPFNAATDEQIWKVLRDCQMDTVIDALDGKLSEMVTEGGENFSQGQRQLLCIARSVLRRPKILVCDEATASIDNATDALVQKMIRENFQDSTVLTIAHRLGTVMDSDRVLVLDDGNISEFDSPEELMKDKKSHFRALVEAAKKSEEG